MTRSRLLTVLLAIFVLPCLTLTASAHYDPSLGRWIERDPLGYGDGSNTYESVGSSPIDRLDPYGMEADKSDKDREREARDCQRKQEQRRRVINDVLSKSGAPITCDPPCVKLTVIIKLPHSCADGWDGKGLGGHTGIGIGDEFYDYGPLPPGVKGLQCVSGDQWWDNPRHWPHDPTKRTPDDINLEDILKNLPRLAGGLDAFAVEVCVCEDEGSTVRGWWQNRYNDLGTYCVAGDQCTTTVIESLCKAKLYTRGLLEFSPLDLLK